MMRERFFCSAESRANGEAIFGTVALVRSWLLLEYPSVWRRRAIEDSWLLPSAVKTHIARLQERGEIGRPLLIRQEHKRTGPLRCFSIDSCPDRPRIQRLLLSDYDELLNANDAGEKIGGLLFAVCTHGRHDKCCARFGLPVSCAMREYAGDRAWECSHVGGDRFAGNVIVFPYGIYYGRVVPDDIPEIVRRSEMGEVWLPRYRGRSCFPRSVQVAEYFARAESGRMAIDEFTPVDTTRAGEDITRVRLQGRTGGAIHVIEYLTRRDDIRQQLTCEAAAISGIPQYSLLRYTVLPA
jgi:hypothetical protein